MSPERGQLWWAKPACGRPQFLLLLISVDPEVDEWVGLYWEPNGDVGEHLHTMSHEHAELIELAEIAGGLPTELSFDAIETLLRAHQERI